jgi:hypothetical protein
MDDAVYWIPATQPDDDVRDRDDVMGEAATTKRCPGEDEGKRTLPLLSTLPDVDRLPLNMLFLELPDPVEDTDMLVVSSTVVQGDDRPLIMSPTSLVTTGENIALSLLRAAMTLGDLQFRPRRLTSSRRKVSRVPAEKRANGISSTTFRIAAKATVEALSLTKNESQTESSAM